MNHEEFQRITGADPTHLNEALRQHLAHCAECVEYYADVLSLESRLRSALEISVPYRPLLPARDSPAVWRYGLAAAFALVTIASLAMLVGFPRQALARAVARHVDHEPSAFVQTQPIDPTELERVLKASHVALRPDGPTVTYANHCELRGHSAFHFAVLAAHGPVVVMVLADDPVSSRQLFSEHGYEGELRPAPRGSIAIVGKHSEDFDAVAASVTARIRYLD